MRGEEMMRVVNIALILMLVLMFFVNGCTTTQKGAVIGSAVGAGSGAIIGHQAGSSGRGALIGAGVGALTGALLGDFIDNYDVSVKKKDRYQAPPEYEYDYYDSNW